MNADELIEEFLAKHVNAIIIKPTQILDAKPDNKATDYFRWQYLIKAKRTDVKWYREQELLHLKLLIKDFWVTHDDSFNEGYGGEDPSQHIHLIEEPQNIP